MELLHNVLYYIYILFFGAYVSMRIACGRMTTRHWQVFCFLSPALLALQGLCLHAWGMDTVRRFYPVLVHLPLAAVLIWRMRVKWSAALVSVALSYSMCQLPRWVGLVAALGGTSWGITLVHLALSQLLLMLLDRFCLDALHEALTGFGRILGYFGAVPALYYGYEYFMVYTGGRFAGVEALGELLPTALVLVFLLFVVLYQRQVQAQRRAEYQTAMLEMELKQSGEQLALLRAMEERSAVARHDLRHHLRMIASLLQTDRAPQALDYILRVQDEADKLTLVRWCEHETLNLLLSLFQSRVEEAGATLRIRAEAPPSLPVPDTELCTLISNALENAIHAVSALPSGQKREIDFTARLRQSKLLLEIRNPVAAPVEMVDGLPCAPGARSGCGCRSIQSIVEKHRGVCTFEMEQGMFVLRAAIPLSAEGEKESGRA